jgi:hypothetical protein
VANILTFHISPFGDLIAAPPNSIIFARDPAVTFHIVRFYCDTSRFSGIFFEPIPKLDPVHTAGSPLMECGCRENENYSLLDRHFRNLRLKNRRSLPKNSKKIFAAMFLIRCWPGDYRAGSWIPKGPASRCPLYPQKRTLVERVVMSALCQKQTLSALTYFLTQFRMKRRRLKNVSFSCFA